MTSLPVRQFAVAQAGTVPAGWPVSRYVRFSAGVSVVPVVKTAAPLPGGRRLQTG